MELNLKSHNAQVLDGLSPFFSVKLVEMQKYSSMTNKNEEGKGRQKKLISEFSSFLWNVCKLRREPNNSSYLYP